MKTILLLTIALCAFTLRATDLFWADKTETGIVGQPGWVNHDLLPTGATIANSYACSNVVTFVIKTNANIPIIPAGDYTVFLHALSNPGSGTAQRPGATVSAGGDSISKDFDDLLAWKKLGTLNIPLDTTTINFSLARTNPVVSVGCANSACTAPWPFTVFGVYLTTQTNVIITGLPELLQVWNYPTSTNVTSPVVRNLLKNSSFEMPFPDGPWSVGLNSTRYYALDDGQVTSEHFDGKSSLAVYFDQCATNQGAQIIRHKPIRMAANKAHTLSCYAKSTITGSTIRFQIFNPSTYPAGSGFPAMPLYDSNQLTITTNWARYSLTNQIMLEYPYNEYYPQITATSASGGTVYIDAVQFEEGPAATTYAPRDTLELGVQIPQKGALLYDDEPYNVAMIFHNGTGSPSSDTVNWRIYHHGYSLFSSGQIVIGSLANTYYTNTIAFPTLKLGFYRIELDIQGKEQINTEADFTLCHRPQNEPKTNFLIGHHSSPYHFMQQVLARAGFYKYRSLSPGAMFRIALAEPSDGTFVYFDTNVERIQQYGMEILGTLDPNLSTLPAWIKRTCLTMTNQTGTYVLGETVTTSGGASGVVTWLSTTNDPVPYPSMQVKSPSGTFATAATLTGGTSGASSTLAARMFVNNTPASAMANVLSVDKWRGFCSNMAAHYTSVTKWEVQNEPGIGYPEIGSTADDGMVFSALMDIEGIKGIREAGSTAKIVINAGHQFSGLQDTHWTALPAATKAEIWGHSFHLYPSILDGRGLPCKAWCDARGLVYLNDETGYEDTSSEMTFASNRHYQGVALDRFQAAETDTRKMMSLPRMLATNVIETVWAGATGGYYYYQMWDRSDAGDELGSLGSHYTTQNIHGTYKAKATSLIFQNYILRQPKGIIITNAGWKVFANVGPTNSQWLALYTANPTNIVMKWGLTSANYECYDMDGNLMSVTSQLVPFSRFPTFVRALNGGTISSMSNAVMTSTFTNAPDVLAPEVVITRCPTGTITAQENASKISISWAGFDDVGMPSANDPLALEYRHKMDSDPFSVWSGLCQLEPQSFASGTHTFYVECRDKALNVSSTAQCTFTVP